MISRRRRRIAVLAALAGAAIAVPAAQAAPLTGICPGQEFSQPFGALGDTAPYTLVPGGDFESTTVGWWGSRAYLVRDSGHTLGLGRDHWALELADGGSVVTPPVCVTADYPFMRFVARSMTGARDAGLLVEVLYDNGGPLQAITVGRLDGARMAAWAATPRLRTAVVLGTVSGAVGGLGDLQVAGAGQMRIRLTATGGAWRVDDMYVDPKMR